MGAASAELLAAVRAVEARGSATADLPPLGEEAHAAAKKAITLLGRRLQSRHELRERLVAGEHPPSAVEEALDRVDAWGLLDDGEFAREWVRTRRARRGRSSGALRRELQSKGIAPGQIEAALEQIDTADEADLAADLVRQRLARRSGALDGLGGPRDPRWMAEKRRLVAFLERRGFPPGLALAVVDEALTAVTG